MRASPRSSLRLPRVARDDKRDAARAAAAAALGSRHPLVAVLRACRTTRDQMLVVASIQAAGAVLLLNLPRFGTAILIAASAVQLALGLRMLVLVETRRELVWQLIDERRTLRGITVVEREARRLAAAQRRARLARSLEQLADMAERPGSYLAGARPYFDVRAVRAVAPELRELAALLRADTCDVRGVALLQSLQACGGSPLYRDSTQPLREQLSRARYLLLLDCELRAPTRAAAPSPPSRA